MAVLLAARRHTQPSRAQIGLDEDAFRFWTDSFVPPALPNLHRIKADLSTAPRVSRSPLSLPPGGRSIRLAMLMVIIFISEPLINRRKTSISRRVCRCHGSTSRYRSPLLVRAPSPSFDALLIFPLYIGSSRHRGWVGEGVDFGI